MTLFSDVTFYQSCPGNDTVEGSQSADSGVTIKGPLCQCVQTVRCTPNVCRQRLYICHHHGEKCGNVELPK